MTELSTYVLAALGVKDGGYVSQRTSKIIVHYDQEIAKGHMTLNTAFERACSDIAGANGHPTKVQRTLKETAQ